MSRLRKLVAIAIISGSLAACASNEKPAVQPTTLSDPSAAEAVESTEAIESTEAMPSSGIPETVTYDLDLSAINLPYDAFLVSHYERLQLQHGAMVDLVTCARERSLDLVLVPLFSDIDVVKNEHFFGPWTLAQAEKYAFVTPSRDADLRANGIVDQDYGYFATPEEKFAYSHNAPILSENDEELEGCGATMRRINEEVRVVKNAPWDNEITILPEKIFEYDQARQALTDLESCMSTVGLKADPDRPGYAAGWKFDVINEQQIEMAVKAVQCKNKTGFTETLAELLAAQQVEIMKKYEKEVFAQKQRKDDALAEVSNLLVGNQHLLEPSK